MGLQRQISVKERCRINDPCPGRNANHQQNTTGCEGHSMASIKLATLIVHARVLSWLVAVYPAHAQNPNASVDQQQREGATNAEGTPVRTDIDKSGYTLFNPTPDDQLRPFSTDRPGKTHSSLTVDAGHFQLESDFWNYTWDRFSRDRTTTRAYSVTNPFLKLGVTNWAEIEIQVPTYNRLSVRSRNGAGNLRARGFGDLLIGGKINLFGNDKGDQALALYPLIKLPTAARGLGNNMVEYSINVPYTIALPARFSVTFEPAVGLLRNLNKQGYHADYQLLANLNRPIIGETVTAALEIAAEFTTDHNIRRRYTIDPSLQWLITPALQLDVGAYIGLNKDAPDYNPYIGISFRY